MPNRLNPIVAAPTTPALPHPLQPFTEVLTLRDFSWSEAQKEAIHHLVFPVDWLALFGEPGTGVTLTCIEALEHLRSKDLRVFIRFADASCRDRLLQRLPTSLAESTYLHDTDQRASAWRSQLIEKEGQRRTQLYAGERDQLSRLQQSKQQHLQSQALQQQQVELTSRQINLQQQLTNLDTHTSTCDWSEEPRWQECIATATIRRQELVQQQSLLQQHFAQKQIEIQSLQQQSEKAPPEDAPKWWTLGYWKKKKEQEIDAEPTVHPLAIELEQLQIKLQTIQAEQEAFEAEHAIDLQRIQSELWANRKEQLLQQIQQLTQQQEQLQQQQADILPERSLTEIETAIEQLQRQLKTDAQIHAEVTELPESYWWNRSTLILGTFQDSVLPPPPDALPIDRLWLWGAEKIKPEQWLRWQESPAKRVYIFRGEPKPWLQRMERTKPISPEFVYWLQSIQLQMQHRTVWSILENRIVCRLNNCQQYHETESVLDDPEISLHFGEHSQLSAVSFPANRPIERCKQYLHTELDEIRIDPISLRSSWSNDANLIWVDFGTPVTNQVQIQYNHGVIELLQGLQTVGLQFDAQHWTLESAKAWVVDALAKAFARQVIHFTQQFRQELVLQQTLSFLGFGQAIDPPIPMEVKPAVLFVPVPEKGYRRELESFEQPGVRHRGAGCEKELADASVREELLARGFTHLPERGYVNCTEAERIRDYLLRAKDLHSVGVATLFSEQAILLQHVITPEPKLQQVPIGSSVDWQNRECDSLLISLTRSHPNRAVPFCVDPNDLFELCKRARKEVIFFGDIGTILRRTQWSGPCEHLNSTLADFERQFFRRFVGQLVLDRQESLIEILTERSARFSLSSL